MIYFAFFVKLIKYIAFLLGMIVLKETAGRYLKVFLCFIRVRNLFLPEFNNLQVCIILALAILILENHVFSVKYSVYSGNKSINVKLLGEPKFFVESLDVGRIQLLVNRFEFLIIFECVLQPFKLFCKKSSISLIYC